MEKIEEKFTQVGLQPTTHRLSIYKYIEKKCGHLTAEDVDKAMKVELPKVSSATIYNTLNSLVEKGLIRELKFPHMNKSIYDYNTKPHYHFLDVESGEISDIGLDEISISTDKLHGFEISDVDI